MKRFIVSCFILFCSWNVAFATGGLVISKVRITGGTGKSAEDFIEIQNKGSEAVNLNGYRLVKRTAVTTFDVTVYVFESDLVLEPGGSFTWANGSLQGSDVVSAQVYGTATISNDNGVALRRGSPDSGELVSSISWGKANNGFVKVFDKNPGAGQVLSLQGNGVYGLPVSESKSKTDSKSANAKSAKKVKVAKTSKVKTTNHDTGQVLGTSTEVMSFTEENGTPVVPLWVIITGFGGVIAATYGSLWLKKKYDSHVQEV